MPYLSKLLLTDDNIKGDKLVKLVKNEGRQIRKPYIPVSLRKKKDNENMSSTGLYIDIIDHWFKHHSLE